MVKVLKFILFIVIIAFSFALGVKFSYLFNGNVLTVNNEDTIIQTEMNRTFENVEPQTFNPANVETQPLTDSEMNEVNNVSNEPVAIEYVDIESVEPMDNVPVAPVETNNQPMDSNVVQTPVEPTPTEPTPVEQPIQPTEINSVPAQKPNNTTTTTKKSKVVDSNTPKKK